MKKIVILGVLGVVGLLFLIYGNDIVGIYRLQKFVSESTASEDASKGPWPNVIYECAGCHGDKGHVFYQVYPSLAGQPEAYLSSQLRNFANDQRKNPTMGPLAMTMTAEEIQHASKYFSAQPVSENRTFRPDPELRKRGEEIVAKGGCAACHGPGLMGANQVPRIAAQSHDYLLDQLNAFHEGTRSSPGNVMNQLASSWSPEDRQAIATFLASHPVSGGGKQ